MTARLNDNFWGLTEKEKQTLRLIVRGHDAKSIARSLGLSVHTINERLRDARRKMAVSSSREAARLLLDVEGSPPAFSPSESCGDMIIRADVGWRPNDEGREPNSGAGRLFGRYRILIGGLLMTLFIGFVALTSLAQQEPLTLPAPQAIAVPAEPQALDAARKWLALVDQGRWDDSYRATGASFRKLNTAVTWAAESEKMRASLGNVIARDFESEENLPAPPAGYEVIKFRVKFAKKAAAIEIVSLAREEGGWRVEGVTID